VYPKRGIPQGSVLGPDMYNIGSFDVPISEKDDGGTVFADDNNVWVLARDTYQLKTLMAHVLEKLEKWAKEADLKFLPAKTKAIVFTRKRIGALPKIYLIGNLIEYVNEAKNTRRSGGQ
jgi:hypothetical protein